MPNNLMDKNSPYYFGVDSTYKPVASKQRPNTQPQFSIGLDGVPYLLNANASGSSKTTDGSVTRVGGQEYEMGNPSDVKALGAVLAADQASRPNQQFADLRGGGGITAATGMQPRVKQTDDMDENMKIWAKANPKLAAKVKAGQSGYGAIQDALGLSSKDEREAASDMMVMGTNPEEAMARAKGGIVEVDIDASGVGPAKINPQGFKDEKMMSLMSTLKDPNITPIVEDMELPDMSKYAGIFNQTDAPDYKTMMENAAMGQLAENLGLSTKGYDTSNYFDRMFGK